MNKRFYGLVVVAFVFFYHSTYSQEIDNRIHIGFTAGPGIPKLPPSRFRTPVSILGGGFLHIPIAGKFGTQVNGYGLTTFNLGTAQGAGGNLVFDLVWGSGDITCQLYNNISARSMLLIGGGYYHLNQQINEEKTTVNTPGLCFGLANWQYHRKLSSVVEIRWHLLFQPDPDPQVLTITFGLFF